MNDQVPELRRPHANPTPPSDCPADPYRWHAIALGVLFTVTIPVLLAIVYSARPRPAPSPFREAARVLGVDSGKIELGQKTFIQSCALCHGKDAQGVARLGKPLRNSAFVQSHSDLDLFQVISRGRTAGSPENTTGSIMPARAGNPRLGDQRLMNVVYYLRTLQDPRAPTATLDDWIIATSGGAGGKPSAGLVGQSAGVGHDVFIASCSACHGAAGEGMDGMGKPLAGSPFIDGKSDEDLIKFVKSGRPMWDAANTTGVDMPPKGGNPALSDEDLLKIVEYIRTLHADG